MTSLDDQLQIGRKRVDQVFRYLEALNRLRNPAKRQLDEQLWSLWLRGLPDHHSVRVGTISSATPGADDSRSLALAGDDFVLKVRRPELTKCPPPPGAILQWLERGWEEPSGTVEVRQSRNELDRNDQTITVLFSDDLKRQQAMDRWRQQRASWAANELPARAAMTVFERLYEINGQIKREGESVELVLGDGTLSWKKPEGSIFHPILLQRLQLEFDPTVPEFSLVEADTPVEFYGALFQSMEDVDGRMIANIRLELDQGRYHPLGKEDTSGFLRSVAVQLSPHGHFHPEAAIRASDEHPVIGRN